MAGALGAIGTGSASVLTSCAGGGESAAANKPLKEPGTYYIPDLPDKATDGKELKAGVIGCGGRGSGAAENFLEAANGVTVVAVADTFKERVDALADKLKEKGCITLVTRLLYQPIFLITRYILPIIHVMDMDRKIICIPFCYGWEMM